MSRLRLAVVGAGHLGRIHARLASEAENIQLLSVVDPVAEAREQLAEQLQTQAVGDYRELFGQIDAAIVASPTSTHCEVVSELLRGGVHVLVEKPITTTVEEADQLVALARQQQLILQVGHVERFNPALTSVQGKLNDPKFIEARRLSGYTFRSTDVGVVLDLMIHDIDAVLSLVQSPVQEVEALGVSVMGDHEDMANARIRFASGCIANLTASRVSYENQRQMQVFTPSSFAAIDFGNRNATFVDPAESILERSFAGESLSGPEREHIKNNLFETLLCKQTNPPQEVNAIVEEQQDFALAIASDSQPQVPGTAGRDALAVAHQILDQVAQHQWDGKEGLRQGPLALPETPHVLSVADHWSVDDTVILRRKAG